TEAALGLPDPLGDRPDLPPVRAEEHDHPIGLAEWIGPKNDALVMPNRHGVRVFGRCVKHLASFTRQNAPSGSLRSRPLPAFGRTPPLRCRSTGEKSRPREATPASRKPDKPGEKSSGRLRMV